MNLCFGLSSTWLAGKFRENGMEGIAYFKEIENWLDDFEVL
jgi:hypothetical protein